MTDQRPPSADIDRDIDNIHVKSRNGQTGGGEKGPLCADENEVVGGGAVVGRDEESCPATIERDISSLSSGEPSSSRGKATSGVAATPPPAKPVLLVESDDDVEEWPEVPLIGRYREEEEDEEVENGNASGDDQGRPVAHSTDGQDGEEGCDHELFWKHKVKQNDTLAGLAVKYKVSISDIKRANGFQTDTAMFGREWVMIPRKPFPIGCVGVIHGCTMYSCTCET